MANELRMDYSTDLGIIERIGNKNLRLPAHHNSTEIKDNIQSCLWFYPLSCQSA